MIVIRTSLRARRDHPAPPAAGGYALVLGVGAAVGIAGIFG